ncbi:MAG: PEP-CTERM sorting domain-containing protein [Burkholderiaceae bacterium]
MKRHLLSCAIAAALSLSGAPALANTVSTAHSVYLNGFTYGPASIMTVQSAAPGTLISPFSVYAGQYSGTLDGKSFVTYCAEITQYLSFNTLYTDYTIVSGVNAWGAAKSAMFDQLISTIMGANINSNPEGSGLAQAAIWEVLYETAPSYGFASGSFDVTGSTSMQTSLNLLDWLGMGAWPIQYHVDLLHSPSAQDLLLITPLVTTVPEPSSYALLLAGLAGFGFVARRRSPRLWLQR